MRTNANDFLSATRQFFAAYDAHAVEGMRARCADGDRFGTQRRKHCKLVLVAICIRGIGLS